MTSEAGPRVAGLASDDPYLASLTQKRPQPATTAPPEIAKPPPDDDDTPTWPPPVGARVRVFWPVMGDGRPLRRWYHGEVTSHNDDDTHTITYKDGDVRDEDLRAARWRLVVPSEPPPPAPPPGAVSPDDLPFSDDEEVIEVDLPAATAEAPADGEAEPEEEEPIEEEPEEVEEAEGGGPSEPEPPADAPTLEEYAWRPDGSLTGYVYGKAGYKAGERMTTSEVPPAGRFSRHVVTASGSVYVLGRPATSWEEVQAAGGVRRSGRDKQRGSLLDAFGEGSHPVEGAPGLTFAVGGVDVGGAAAERIMRQAFGFLDDNVVDLRAQWSNARRVVLLRGDAVVAASVVEAHAERAVLEVPILAAAKAARQQGYGSVLVATLIALGVRMRLKLLLVSATAESHGFWLRQGLHTPAYCSPAVRAMLRTVDQAAVRRSFANSLSMAMLLPPRRRARRRACGRARPEWHLRRRGCRRRRWRRQAARWRGS